MGRSREEWYVDLAGVGVSLEGAPGSFRPVVHLQGTLERDPERNIRIILTPDQAEVLAESLQRYAVEVRELQARREAVEKKTSHECG